MGDRACTAHENTDLTIDLLRKRDQIACKLAADQLVVELPPVDPLECVEITGLETGQITVERWDEVLLTSFPSLFYSIIGSSRRFRESVGRRIRAHNRRTGIVEYLIDATARREAFMARLVLMTSGFLLTFMIRIVEGVVG